MKKQNIIKKKMGFSLLELSIVIIVIGLLVLGITKGSVIIAKAKIASAKALTNSSPAAITPDLVAWYEPVLDSSFNSAQVINGTTLTNANGGSWFDNSPLKGNNATTVTGAITYRDSVINNLPAVRFGGSMTLAFNSSSLNQKDYTVFVVEQRGVATSGTVGRFLSLGGLATTPNSIGYSGALAIGDSNGGSSSVPGYVVNSPVISTFLASNITGGASNTTRSVFVNGAVGSTVGTNGSVITATASGLIGADIATTASSYNGDIAEIIIYNRALKASERNDIQGYLSKKYGIKVTTST